MEAVVQRVEILLQQNRYEEARGLLMQRLSEDPEHPLLNAFLAYCLRLEGRAEEALTPARLAVSRAPEWCFVHYVLAVVLDGTGKAKEAMSAIDQAIALDPSNAAYHGMKAGFLMRKMRWHEAIASAEQGLQYDPMDTQCRGILTAAKNQLGRHVEVDHLVDESLRHDPEDALAFANKGWSTLRQRRPKEAVQYFREALRLDPELEYARLGVLEALKARNFIYRWILAYFFKMGTLPGSARIAIILGLFIGFRIVRSIGQENPALRPFVTPLVIAYIVFAYTTWVGASLANCALLFHPFGRLAMTRNEKRDAIVLGTTLLLGIVMLFAAEQTGVATLGNMGLILVMITIPLVGTQNASTRKGILIGAGMTGGILGLALLGELILPPLYGIAVLLWIAYIWGIGHYVARN